MSTYTDLHNRIKENLTILRKPGSTDDGMSPQKVILVNPENQFYGTFFGQMNVTGGTLSDLALVGGTLNGTTIKDAKFLDGNQVVPIGELAASVSEHEQRISDLEFDKDVISAAHDSLSAELSSAIDGLSTSVTKNIADSIAEVMADISGAVAPTISIDVDDLPLSAGTGIEITHDGYINANLSTGLGVDTGNNLVVGFSTIDGGSATE